MAALTRPRSSIRPSSAKPRRTMRMSYDEFLQTDFDHNHFEWVDGRVVERAPVESNHDAISGFLFRILSDWLDENGGGRITMDPFQMRLAGRPSGRAPDLQIILPRSLPRLKKMYMDGPADVVIEIISTGSRSTDRRTKFAEYEQAGVPEYWLIDPLRKQAEFYVHEKGRFIPAELDEKTGRFHSRMLRGVWLDVEWLWDLPSKAEILKKWKVK
ncbi:MAG: Uma2 family endonuclease [Phycisphaerae bacterium]|nr:Uma2 family endonuclease [Phycisphaerae bacterium]